jgi:hypothetical protein
VAVDPGALLDRARAALRQLAEAPHVVEAALAAEAELDRTWQRTPWAIGLVGDPGSRTALVNLLAEERLFDVAGRPPGSAALRIQRGSTTTFRAVGVDDQITDGQIPGVASLPPAVRAEAEALRGQLAQQQALVVATSQRVPEIARREGPIAWWLRPIRWLARLIWGRMAVPWREARATSAQLQRKLDDIEGAARRGAEDWRRRREGELRPLREIAARRDIREVTLVLATSALPAGVEIIELVGTARAEADVDAVLLAGVDGIYAPARDGRSSERFGDAATIVPELAQIATRARALRITLRVRDRLRSGCTQIDEAVASAELSFRARLEQLDARRVEDPTTFVANAVTAVLPQVFTSVHAILEHASVHLGSELAELARVAIESIAAVTNGDELKVAAAKIDETWDATTKRIAEEVRVLVAGGAAGSAHDLIGELLRLLVPHGLTDAELRARRPRPELPALEVLPSIVRPKEKAIGGTRWLSGLFQSFDARRAKARERAHEAIEHLKQVASAELLELEPRLHAMIRDAIAAAFAAAVARVGAALDATITAERLQIDREREALADALRARDRAASDAADLEAEIARFEAASPAVAAAAVGAMSASAVFKL